MATMIDENAALGTAAPTAADGTARGARRSAVVLAAALVAVAVLYAVLALQQPVPFLTPDEYTYGHLSWSVSAGDGLSWHGTGFDLRAALYVYLLAPAWWLGSSVTGYGAAKVLSTALLCSVAVPTYLLARAQLGPRIAAVPAAITLAGTWMLTAAGLLTENLAFPLSTASLAATVTAIRVPDRRWRWVAILFAGLAAWARIQMLVLGPIILAALALDVVRRREHRGARLRLHGPALATGAALAAVGAVLALAAPSAVIGSYSGITSFHPPVGRVLELIGAHWIDIVAMAGFVPAAAFGLALSRRAWRDDELGPLLCVTVPATGALLVQAALATAGWDLAWSIQRYVEYALPLLFVLAVVASRRTAELARPLALGAVAVCAGLLVAPDLHSATEERAVFATDDLAGKLIGGSTATNLALVGLVACGAVALWWMPAVRNRLSSAMPLMAGVVILILAFQGAKVWSWQISMTRQLQSAAHAPLRWFDQHVTADVARLGVAQSGFYFGQLEFFNRRVTRDYALPRGLMYRHDAAPNCTWTLLQNGDIDFARACGAAPTRLYFDDPIERVALYGQRVVAQHPVLGRVVETRERPRLMSVLTLPCPSAWVSISADGRRLHTDRRPCRPYFGANFWLDGPAKLVVRFRGTDVEHAVQAQAGRVVSLPPGKVTTITWDIPAGPSSLRVGLDWQGTDGPQMVDAELLGAGRRTSLLY